MTRRTFFTIILSLILSLFFKLQPTQAEYDGEDASGIEFPIEFPLAFDNVATSSQPNSTTLLSFKSLTFWERLLARTIPR